MVHYPTRCRIIDVTGRIVGEFRLNTPEVSRPHVGKEGLAEKEGDTVRITLDDETVLFGNECWWEPIP